jgi:deferrochelatase/peroxidase EfeB
MSPSRRGLLAGAGGLAAALGTSLAARAGASAAVALPATEPFWGAHQAGILTPAQGHSYFAALDLVTTKPGDIVQLLRAWTDAAARMAVGQTAAPPVADLDVPASDSSDALGLPASRLTLKF